MGAGHEHGNADTPVRRMVIASGILTVFFVIELTTALLIAPPLNGWFFDVVYWLFDLSGVSGRLAAIGNHLTRFWSAWL